MSSLSTVVLACLNVLSYAGLGAGLCAWWLVRRQHSGIAVLLGACCLCLAMLLLGDFEVVQETLSPLWHNLLRRFFGRGVISLGLLWFFWSCLRPHQGPTTPGR